MLLNTTNLTIGYGSHEVQKELNLSADNGALISLVGTNGAGKSTLLRTIAGLQKSLGGTIEINGKNIDTLTSHDKAKLMSLVLTDRVDIENMSVRQLVAMGRFPYTNWLGKLTTADDAIIDKAIADVNLSHKAEANINHISDGEKQRAIIAKALAQDTPLVLLDEPTAHLDLPNRIETMLLLRRLSVTTRKTFILSTHELELVLQTSDQVWLMTRTGVKTGIPEDLMLSGCFQRAFGSANFSFDAVDGHCVINHLYGNLKVNVVSSDSSLAHSAWLRRALMRTGIVSSSDAETNILCSEKGYQIKAPQFADDTVYLKISDLLTTLNNITVK